jgi:hypothetical protein
MSSPVSCRGAGLTILRGGAVQAFTAELFHFPKVLNEMLIDLRGGSVRVLTVERFWR